ncbi:hypothetical protein J7E71_19235 [Mesobacillus foraminis]|uniref:hypothetical protein n=1 Tax=Mesobacillus foraminis TaxID=279826 RepID=UPI001BE5CD5A|nr:hypothetical protein [Mesobacillus foraminis]MBT2758008.1 hypothetical protein [Mesobacillus foraminis]
MGFDIVGVHPTKRKRYIITIESNGDTQQAVIVADDTEEMNWLLKKLYGHLLVDRDGKRIGNFRFEENELG